MEKLVVIRQGFQCTRELKKLLGARLISASEAAALMLSAICREKGWPFLEVSKVQNQDDYLVRVCVASEEGVLRALHALARHTNTLIKEIDVVEVQVAG